MEESLTFLSRHLTEVLLFLILLFVATPDAKKERLAEQLRWIALICVAGYFLGPFVIIALWWLWKHLFVSVVIGYILALLGAWIYSSRQNRAIRREYKTMGDHSPAFKQRVSSMVADGYNNERAVAVVTSIATGNKLKQ